MKGYGSSSKKYFYVKSNKDRKTEIISFKGKIISSFAMLKNGKNQLSASQYTIVSGMKLALFPDEQSKNLVIGNNEKLNIYAGERELTITGEGKINALIYQSSFPIEKQYILKGNAEIRISNTINGNPEIYMPSKYSTVSLIMCSFSDEFTASLEKIPDKLEVTYYKLDGTAHNLQTSRRSLADSHFSEPLVVQIKNNYNSDEKFSFTAKIVTNDGENGTYIAPSSSKQDVKPPQPTTNTTDGLVEGKPGLGGGAIAGIVIGVIVGIALIAGICFAVFYIHNKKKSQESGSGGANV